jgi:hypothetical protein
MSAKNHARLAGFVFEKAAATGVAFGGEKLRRTPVAE